MAGGGDAGWAGDNGGGMFAAPGPTGFWRGNLAAPADWNASSKTGNSANTRIVYVCVCVVCANWWLLRVLSTHFKRMYSVRPPISEAKYKESFSD